MNILNLQQTIESPVIGEPPEILRGSFGSSFDINGEYLAIVAPSEDWSGTAPASPSGAIHVYKHNGIEWNLFQSNLENLITEPSFPNGFDFTPFYSGRKNISILGEKIAVGSPYANKVYIFQFNGSSWEYYDAISALSYVSISYGDSLTFIDEDLLAISDFDPVLDPTSPYEGKVYIYKLDVTVSSVFNKHILWDTIYQINASSNPNWFGWSIFPQVIGTDLVLNIGSPGYNSNEGAVYSYNIISRTQIEIDAGFTTDNESSLLQTIPNPLSAPNSNFGIYINVDNNGLILAISDGGNNIELFNKSSNSISFNWILFQSINTISSASPFALKLINSNELSNSSNNILLVGVPNHSVTETNGGKVCVFEESSGSFSLSSEKFSTVIDSGDSFGYEIGFHPPSELILVGSPGESGVGEIHSYLYEEEDIVILPSTSSSSSTSSEELTSISSEEFSYGEVDIGKIVTILKDRNLVSENRTLYDYSGVQSIRIHPINSYFFVCMPLSKNNSLIIFPPNPNSLIYQENNLSHIEGYGDLKFPLDATFDYFNKKYLIADAGNQKVVIVDAESNSFEKSLDNFILPHSIIFNKNDKSFFIKSFINSYTQKITQINRLGDPIFEFEFPADISTTYISLNHTYLGSIPKYFTMDFDANLNRLWFVSKSVLYMVDLDNKHIIENNLLDFRLKNLSCVSIEKGSGNAFVVIDDGVNYYVQQIFKDNNLKFGLSFLRS
jgi:hypothetical protein